ncbi:hypothetical protein CEXT_130391 [Caerostris extrusa]|uniref:Uncharacterized protein n=1 Tax=Caerostris extrusa TaxID=172846 RepID=A0AAV4PJH4_CAEEX|nr:hypothetical protein CEXT_130391 [Caerostris extrusa]
MTLQGMMPLDVSQPAFITVAPLGVSPVTRASHWAIRPLDRVEMWKTMMVDGSSILEYHNGRFVSHSKQKCEENGQIVGTYRR